MKVSGDVPRTEIPVSSRQETGCVPEPVWALWRSTLRTRTFENPWDGLSAVFQGALVEMRILLGARSYIVGCNAHKYDEIVKGQFLS
jgi:hypothetical protein